MNDRISLHTDATPAEFLARLREVAGSLPASGRMHPPHVTGVYVTIKGSGFSLECRRSFRDFIAPVCRGRATPEDGGTRIDASIRRSRVLLGIPVAVLALILVNWVRDGRLSVAEALVGIVGSAFVLGFDYLLGLTRFDVHLAEADALVALVRSAAGPNAGAKPLPN